MNNAVMLGKSLGSPLLLLDSLTWLCYSTPDGATSGPSLVPLNPNSYKGVSLNLARGTRIPPKKWVLYNTKQVENFALNDEDEKTWEACREALATFDFSVEEKDKILKKAFGFVHSPYWSEERKKELPKVETVNEVLDYLRSLSLSDEDVYKLLKKFPEVLGCSLEHELRRNVGILEKDWAIKGKTLRNLLLRNPKVLGFSVDCKGDCMAQCTRCWVRF